MVDITYLVSTVLMGLLLAGVAVAVARVYHRPQFSAAAASGGPGGAGGPIWTVYDRLERVAYRESVWTAGFLVLAVLLVAIVALFLGDEALRASLGPALAALFGTVVLGFVLLGLYRTLRLRGRSRAEAVGVGMWTLGLVFLLAVAAKLVLA
jgi:hypothetical protein